MIPSLLLSALLSPVSAQEQLPWASSSTVVPAYVALLPNIHDFTRFADGGNDYNWYIGYNNAWIVKLPAAPMGEYSRAFVGAKVGRAKTKPNPNKPWQRDLIDGQVYIGVSPTPSWTAAQSYFLTETAEIPAEPDAQSPVEGVGASEWFWAEVPVSAVNFSGPNYLAVWSPTKYFLRASSSPILAAGPIDETWPSREPRAWNNRSISGVPPRSPAGALQTPVASISPALALKLIPTTIDEVGITEFTMREVGRKHIVDFSAGGENVSEAWVETSKDQLDWSKLTKARRRPPYVFTIPHERFPQPGEYLRGAARDAGGNIGRGEAVMVPFPPPPVQQ